MDQITLDRVYSLDKKAHDTVNETVNNEPVCMFNGKRVLACYSDNDYICVKLEGVAEDVAISEMQLYHILLHAIMRK